MDPKRLRRHRPRSSRGSYRGPRYCFLLHRLPPERRRLLPGGVSLLALAFAASIDLDHLLKKINLI